MSRTLRRMFLAVSFLLAVLSPLIAQTPPAKQRVPKVIASHNDWTASPQELFAPYWTLEPGWNTELELRNNVPWHDLRITPVLRTTDGTEVSLAPVDLKPEEVVSVNLKDAVALAKPELLGKTGAFGSVVFRFDGTGGANAFAGNVVSHEGHPIDFHFDADDAVSREIEGIWWLPAQTSTTYLILSNPGSKPVTGKLVLTDVSGSAHRLSLTVGPRQSVRTDIRQALPAPASGAFGGLSLSTGKEGGLSATEIIFDEVTGLATIMKLFDRQPIADFDTVEGRVLRAPMMALSQPDRSLGFPAGTVLDPKIFLRNASAAAAVVSPGVNWHSDNTSGTSPLPRITLLPGQIKIMSLADFQKTGQIPQNATWATVTLSFTGRSADIVAVAMSYDKTSRYGLQTPFSEGTNSQLKGSMWHVDDTHNTLITMGNGGDEQTRGQVTLFYNGGQSKYRVEKRLPPGQQVWLNLGELLRNQAPDSDGKVIPPDVMFGSYELRDLDHPVLGLLYEGKLVVDKTYGHASYGCTHCCGFSSSRVSPTPFSGPPGMDNPDTYQAYSVCMSAWDDFDFATNWQSTNTAVATLPNSTLHTVAVGTASGSARNTLAYQQYPGYPCPNEPMVGNQPVTVATCGDERDQIIQEYITYGVSLLPVCANFTQTAHSTYFAFSELNTGDYTWALVRQPLTVAQSSGYGLDDWRSNYGSSRIVNSAYRNPAHNSQVGGATNSRHMYGDAVDLRNQSGGVTEWNAMVTAANSAHADFVEPQNGPCGLACTHADWRAHSGGYSQ